jgi:hypothetical protein
MDREELGLLLRQAASTGCEDGIKRASKYMVANCGQDDAAIDACLAVWKREVGSLPAVFASEHAFFLYEFGIEND